MAGTQDRVQEYLQKHKIGNLFEELMAKVVSEMPIDPVIYMIQTLERKAGRSGNKALLRKSMGDLGGISVVKDRQYEKPWQTNTKRQRNKKLGETSPSKKGIEERPEWDNKAKTKSCTFDDFWEESGGAARRPVTAPARAKNQPSWADDAQDEELLYSCQAYNGPRRFHEADDDPLAGEFSLIQEKPQPRATTRHVSSSRYSGPKVKAENHRHALKEIIKRRQHQTDSGIDDDANQGSDDAIEIMENAEDLIAEGAKNVKRTGIKVRHTYRQTNSDAQVKISICGRCAKVMTGDKIQESEPISTVRNSPDLTDDEFESVSQVTGPRRPVWQNSDSEEDALPSRGAFSSRERDLKQKTDMRATVSGARSMDAAISSPLKGHASFNQTWSPDSQPSPDIDATNDDDSVGISLHGSGWGRPPPTEPTDYDSDISMPVRRGSRGKIRNYQGQF